MTVDQFLAANLPAGFYPTDVECFQNFGLDMTECYHKQWNEAGRVERVPAMQKVSGQKQSERMLWHVGPATPANAAAARDAERAANVEAMAAKYAANPEFELEVDPCTFAIGLAKAYRHHTGEMPTFLLDDDGEL